ncbi:MULTISPECIES: glycosyltransferase [unclassified Butyrivibrio]|uniref:glycosyltransferase n=1 Tax=unclassified Butyrivibrio TaxID=2639466 RepID=UPI0004261E36|nr:MULTISPECIES: glycosyltransferase [unclassified Butyrivibrio]
MIGEFTYKLIGKESEQNKIIDIKNRIVRKIGSRIIPLGYIMTPVKLRETTKNVIISLTTYGERADTVWITIESLFRQKGERANVVLWLSENEFSANNLPKNINKLVKRGLEVRFCKDIKSYKKIFYCAKENREKIIITVDDDCIYPPYFLKKLLKANEDYPDTVCCYRCNKMILKNGKLAPYSSWVSGDDYSAIPRHDIVATGCGGVLYPAFFFKKNDLNNMAFCKIAPNVDDMWLKCLELKNNYKVCQIVCEYQGWIAVRGTKKTALYNTNVCENKNDIYFNKLLEYYNLDINTFITE